MQDKLVVKTFQGQCHAKGIDDACVCWYFVDDIACELKLWFLKSSSFTAGATKTAQANGLNRCCQEAPDKKRRRERNKGCLSWSHHYVLGISESTLCRLALLLPVPRGLRW